MFRRACLTPPPSPLFHSYTAVIEVVQKLGQALDISDEHQEVLKFGDFSDPDVVDSAVTAAEALHRNTTLPPELELLNDTDAVQMQLSLYEELRVSVQDNLSGYITGVFKAVDAAKSLQRVKQSGKLQSFSAEYGPTILLTNLYKTAAVFLTSLSQVPLRAQAHYPPPPHCRRRRPRRL